MEAQLSQWWILLGPVVTVLAQIIKRQIPGDLPITGASIALMLSFLTILGVRAIFAPDMSTDMVFAFVAQLQVSATFSHIGLKAANSKLNGGTK